MQREGLDTCAAGAGRAVVGVAGNVRRPSRTAALVTEIVDAIAAQADAAPDVFDMTEVGGDILSALTPPELTARGHAVISRVVAADILVIGSPIYRATYTGAIKHLFDLIDYRALRGAIGVVALTGGSAMHGLAAEQAVRNMMNFFQILPLPTAIFALDSDFDGERLRSVEVRERIARAADEAALLTRGWARPRFAQAA